MILVSLHDIVKGFPSGDVLTGVDWEIKTGEKIALVGQNGSGKTTLMGILMGRLAADRGTRTLGRGVRISELGQIPERGVDQSLAQYVLEGCADVLALRDRAESLAREVERAPQDVNLQTKLGVVQSELEHAGGYDLERRAETILSGLGFVPAQWSQAVAHLSGGERTRVELARLLITPSDLLLLDEPTNHLDIPAMEWLEQFLIDSECAVILVSHDRVFLDRFAGRVVDLAHGRLEMYDGNFARYRSEKPLRIQRRRKAYGLQQAEIARIEDFIVRNIAGQKTKQAQSRRRALGKLERLEKPAEDTRAMKFGFETDLRSFRKVLTVRGYEKQIGGRTLLSGVDFACERGDKIGVIGPNGSGKSTLLRSLIGMDDRYGGQIRIGDRVEIGYFDQHLETLTGTGSVIQEIWEAYPHFEAGPLRSYLARFLFTGEDVFKSVADLSGGEKNRLALAKLMLSKSNFLVLDEPTNHLDIAAREVLEEAIAGFEGTALVVSHDRRFLDRFATKILYVADGHASMSLGNYSDWAARRASAERPTVAREEQKAVSDAALQWQEQKRARTEARKIEKQRLQLESEIADLERQVQVCETELADEATARDWKCLATLTARRTELYDELAELYKRLESLPES